ncbi:hypothetical protein [Bradyrhizobium sp. CCBAU 65884]|uniref:hypothetical protein n=1 Tax=Bradyrhizobium sp. CCBAU 65884 TaxID=722477 RepID=UPI0023054DB0|nr:hypothetical protein [Bradyrhizobium sp. CCBAU 65884]
MMRVILRPVMAMSICGLGSTAFAQNPAFDICSTLATSGLINKSERRFAEETANQQWHEICRERSTRVVKANSASASLKIKIYQRGSGRGSYSSTNQFDQTDIDNFCDKGAEDFVKSVAEQESSSIGQYLADSVNTCLRLATQYGLEWTGGYVELDPGADDRFIVDVKHIPGRTSEKYKLEQLGGSAGVGCFLDGDLQRTAIGAELGAENSYTCKRETGQPVAARLIFVGTGNRANTINIPIRATSSGAIERLKAELLRELLPANAVIPFISESCPSGWKELSVPGRFLVGASPTQRGGEQGGQSSVRLAEGNLPPHRHSVYQHAGYHLGGPPPANRPDQQGAGAGDTTTGVHGGTTSDGGFPNLPFEIIPPWIAVRYCQRSVAAVASGER